MKKLSITFVFSFGLIGVLLTACFCKDVQPYWRPISGSTSVFSMLDNNLVEVNPGDTVQADSIALLLNFEAEFVSMKYSPLAQLTNVARATQKCPVDGHQGLKNKIATISIMSNENYNGIDAGQDISQFFRHRGQPLSISYVDLLNNYGYENMSYGLEREIYLIDQPINSIDRNLTVEIEFENDEAVTMQTLNFTW
jgi:hypothetical protein